MSQKIFEMIEDKMKKSIETTRKELMSIRTGRASSALLDNIKVEYYNSQVPINQVANVNVPESRTIEIKPWDKSVIPAIEKAIIKSELGLNPSNDGKIIRISIPMLTEERRKELVKAAKKIAEDGKIAIRNIRRELMLSLDVSKDKSELSEDDVKKSKDRAQKLTDAYIKEVDTILANKEKEILTT
ncbi:MAG: ribosome recycling factor [Candidatus Firestonebacteria bacterium]